MSFSQHLRQLGRPIAYYPQLAKPLGGVTAAVLFGQLFYWQDKTDNPLGVYKTLDELMDETGLTERELRSAREKLRELGVVVETNKRLEHRLYFKVDYDAFDRLMETSIREETKRHSANCQSVVSPNDETSIREETKRHSVNTKTTTKNTNNNTSLTGSISAHTKKTTDLSLLEEFGITDQLAEDFIKHRKACKATITKTALDGFQREADKAGISIREAVAISIERGWRGFKASWDWRGEGQVGGERKMTFAEKNALPWNRPEDWEGVF
ncbi:DNA replication protein [Basfia succiniciproducens]|uniref:DNA replication protein n=1 Tax=Basfia succiniciproducens TaxID=653940 RepID=UPI003FCDDB98